MTPELKTPLESTCQEVEEEIEIPFDAVILVMEAVAKKTRLNGEDL